MNSFKTFLLMTALFGVFLFVGRILGGSHGMVIAFILALVMNVGSYWFSDRVVLAMHRAREVTPQEETHLYRAVQKLSLAGNMPVPRIYVIESDSPNAFATGRNINHAAVAATRGILDLLSPVELEAVVAHELSHIRHRDMLIGTLAAVMAGTIMMVADMARWAALLGGYSNRDDDRGANPLGFILLAILAPLAAMLIQLMISRSREFAADEGSAALTANPMALARALKKIEAAALGEPLETASPATAHMYIINPFDREGWLRNLFSTHPSTSRRVARLEAIQEGRIRASF